jgi:hypothetical protein
MTVWRNIQKSVVMSVADKYWPSGFLVLDVVEECITELPRESQYIALSYVWGQTESLCLELGNIAEMKCPGSLRARKQKVGKTILDAIEVV